MTPHINAKKNEIAKMVLMTGDPLRTKHIAENFLENPRLVNSIRGMLMYTGKYNGKEITVAGHGMGRPSMGIYAYELFKFYDVDNIIRLGSAGSYKSDLELYDVVLATSVYSDNSTFSEIISGVSTNDEYPSELLNQKLLNSAKQQNIEVKSARVHSSDVFYAIRPIKETIKITQSECVEMEAAALFTCARVTGKTAACLLTISDNLITNEVTTAEERQTAFNNMIKIALNSL